MIETLDEELSLDLHIELHIELHKYDILKDLCQRLLNGHLSRDLLLNQR